MLTGCCSFSPPVVVTCVLCSLISDSEQLSGDTMTLEQTAMMTDTQEAEFTFSDSYIEDLDIYSPVTFLSNDSNYHEGKRC